MGSNPILAAAGSEPIIERALANLRDVVEVSLEENRPRWPGTAEAGYTPRRRLGRAVEGTRLESV
jgi:hypothetical protein